MLLEKTKINTRGLTGCCLDTIVNLDQNVDFQEGTTIDCRHEHSGNKKIIFENGIWKYNKEK